MTRCQSIDALLRSVVRRFVEQRRDHRPIPLGVAIGLWIMVGTIVATRVAAGQATGMWTAEDGAATAPLVIASVEGAAAAMAAPAATVAMAAPATVVPTSLSDCLELASLHNAGLLAAFESWRAALERVPQVRAHPDPRFNFSYMIREVETRVGPQRAAFNLSQTFPWFGKLRLRGDAAFEASEAARRRYEARKLRLFYRVKDAYYELYYLERAVEIARRNLDLLRDLERVARARYRTAATRQADVIKAQVELGRLEDRVAALEEMRAPLAARLNALMNRPVDAPLPRPAAPPAGSLQSTDAEILAWVAERSPELLALDHEVRRGEREVELAGKAGYPDLTFGFGYIVTDAARMPGVTDSGKDPLVATLSVNLPLWRGSYRAGARAAEARLRAAQQARTDRARQLEAEVKRLLFDCRDTERKIDLYRDTLIPKGDQSLESAETAFMAGHLDFLDVIEAQRTLLEFELAGDRALVSHAQRLAELEMVVGRAIPTTESGP